MSKGFTVITKEDMMGHVETGFVETGWKNKRGTAGRICFCGSWAQHWVNFSNKSWPERCSVFGCSESPTLGSHIWNPKVLGEWIVPMCDSCNKSKDAFDLKANLKFVSANKSRSCEASVSDNS